MELFLTIAFTHFIALLTPGIDFFLILKTLLQTQKSAARSVCLGIALGNAFILLFIYLSLFVMGKVSLALLEYLKYIGAVYLVYLAIQCLHAAKGLDRNRDAFTKIDIENEQMLMARSNKYFMLIGLASSLLNPKNIMFYSTLLILIYSKFSFIENLSVSIWMVGVVLIWNLCLVQLLSFKAYSDWLRRNMQYLYIVSGFSFGLFAVLLLVI